MELADKVAVVTGGLSGIGRAIVELFSERGATVVVFDRLATSRDDGLPGQELVARLPHAGHFIQGDVSQPGEVDHLFETVVSQFGRADVLVNCAGVTVFKPIEQLTVEDYQAVMDVNVRGTFLCCRSAVQVMRQQPARGVIVNVASNFAFVGAPEATLYSASKGAVVSMTKALALEVSPHGIRVNALCPGATATEFNRAYRNDPAIVRRWAEMTPLRIPGREEFLASPQQIAYGALFLASDQAQYMTGAALVADGGWNAG